MLGLLVLVFALVPLSGCEEIRRLIESISDGAPCTTSGQCLGGVCIDEFPGGYCSTDDCFTRGCTNIFGSECLAVAGVAEPYCYDICDSNEDCRNGYSCLAVETSRVCLPASFNSTLSAAGALGSACENNAACDSGTCLTNLVGGYCSVLDCSSDSECGGGRCMELVDEDAGTSLAACFASCTGNSGCRFGYECRDPDGQGGICMPRDEDDRSPVRNPNGLNDGEPCTVGINCKGGTCLRAAEGYPGGYCTTLDCASVGCNTPSGGATLCRSISEETLCYVSCRSDATCREGYDCLGSDLGEGYCAPPPPSTPAPTEDEALGVTCDSGGARQRMISFEIKSSTVAFAVVPFSETSTVRPRRLLLPNGSVGANFDEDHEFMNINPFYIETAAPVFFPAAPQFQSIVQQGGGTYQLEVTTGTGPLCWYVLEKSAVGREIDVNIYFVGIPGLTSATAGSHSKFNTMLNTFISIYRGAGITVKEIRYFDASTETAERFAIIRDLNEVFNLIATGNDPGPTLADKISVDVYLIKGFSVPEAPGLLGMSLGLPGVPGMHGSDGTGLIFTTEYLSGNAQQVGQTMAHEVGHFNGLRHTSEHGGKQWDPLSDTPQCSNPELGRLCPDANNLMFPFSLGTNQETVTSQQGAVLQASPHTR